MKASAALAQALRDASRIVARVQRGRSLSDELDASLEDRVETPRSALIDLCHGTLRRHARGPAIVRALSNRSHSDALVDALLWCSLYAVESGRYAEYTVVDQAVAACGLLGKWNAKGYVNALLRAYLRGRATLEARIERDPEVRYQHPRWWIDALHHAYPDDWERILATGNEPPPMCLRINRKRIQAEEYRARLAESGIASRRIGESALLLERPVPISRLPGFLDGEVSVQDACAQRAAQCLDVADGQRILDACAAPGGKSGHLLELADVQLTSLDANPDRCRLIERNLRRLRLAATVQAADCTRLEAWWDGKLFDRILADVPCSASGVVRRHPDLKWLRREGDLAQFATRQAVMLDVLWQALGTGGKLLYATCSLFPRENEEIIEAFVERAKNAQRLPLPDGAPSQWLPSSEHDGFYFALIAKKP